MRTISVNYDALSIAHVSSDVWKKCSDLLNTHAQESPLIPFNIGMVYYQMNRLQDVERYMKMALKLDSNFDRARTMLAKLGAKEQ